MSRISRCLSIALCVLPLAGCGSFRGSDNKDAPADQPEASRAGENSVSRSGLGAKTKGALYQVKPAQSLEIPPDLTAGASAAVLENAAADPEQEFRVLPEVVGAEIVNDGGAYRLVVDTAVENAWQVMTEYWALGSIDLVVFNPEAGLMETDWIEEPKNYEASSTFFAKAKSLFASLTKSDTAYDRFRLRFERLGDDRAAIHVFHRWIARKVVVHKRKESEFIWVELDPDSERVADFMNNIILLFDSTAGQQS